MISSLLSINKSYKSLTIVSLFQIASHSKSSTKSRFWNRSFHILSCERSMKSDESQALESYKSRTSIALDKSSEIERSRYRLERLKEPSWSRRCSRWQSFLVPVIIVLLNITSIECLQARQEGEWLNPKPQLRFHSISLHNLHIFEITFDYHEAEIFIFQTKPSFTASLTCLVEDYNVITQNSLLTTFCYKAEEGKIFFIFYAT